MVEYTPAVDTNGLPIWTQPPFLGVTYYPYNNPLVYSSPYISSQPGLLYGQLVVASLGFSIMPAYPLAIPFIYEIPATP